MPDFWRNSGYHLLERDDNGHLVVGEDFLRAYLVRPEVRPVDESCDVERALHAELLAEPGMTVPAARIEELADVDARDNYRVVLAFIEQLRASGTLEACYMAQFGSQQVSIPALFIDQMAHVVLRNILEGCDDPMRVRAAEMLFRQQTVTIQDGAILAADTDTVEMYATSGGFGDLGRLLVEGGTVPRGAELDVLNDDNAATYWQRDERHDTVIDLTFARPGLDALCRVLEAWVAHFLEARVSIQPVQQISDEHWVWHLGLDAEATGLLNDLYDDADVDDARRERLLSLFRLEFEDPSLMRADVAGRPVYMAIAMTEAKTMRLKPQNLLVNLPLARKA